MTPLVTHLIALLTGILVGAGGTYLADKFTDERRSKDEEKRIKRRLAEAEKLMPGLIAEMREDVCTDPTGTKREFFPYDVESIYSPGADKFFYDPAKHPDLESKLVVLENSGFIVNVSDGDTLRYRMREDFVSLLKRTATKKS